METKKTLTHFSTLLIYYFPTYWFGNEVFNPLIWASLGWQCMSVLCYSYKGKQIFFFCRFFQSAMSNTMEGRSPFCHNWNSAASQELTSALMVWFWRVGQVKWLKRSDRVASKQNGSRFAVSLPPVQTVFDSKHRTWSHLSGLKWDWTFFFSAWKMYFFVSWQLIPSQIARFLLDCIQCACIVSPCANSMPAIWEPSLPWKATLDVLLTEAAELAFKWPIRAASRSSSAPRQSEGIQVHVCLFSTCHDIAWLHPPPHHLLL